MDSDANDSSDSDNSDYSDWESEDSEETMDLKEEIAPITTTPQQRDYLEPADIIALADPITKVLILDGKEDHKTFYNLIKYDYVDNWSRWEENKTGELRHEQFGPDCHLCGEMISPDENIFSIYDNYYSIIWKDSAKEQDNDESVGFLQCVYCFNFYHRHKCSLSMTTEKYLDRKQSKSWCCVECAPIFYPMSKRIFAHKNRFSAKYSENKLLINIFKFVYKFVNKNECNVIVDFNVQLDVFNQIFQTISEFGVFDHG